MNTQQAGTETRIMQDQFAFHRRLLAQMKSMLDTLEAGSARSDQRIAGLKEGIFCFELALTFFEEANLALQAGACFAAASIASSALESVLLSKCFFQEEEIKALPKFQKLKRSYRADFGLFARSMDLGKLLEIANELSWFPDGGVPKIVTSYMAAHLDEPTLVQLVGIFDGITNVGRSCANHVREYRNLLHPAVCLKEGRQPSRESGLSAAFLFMIAFSSLAEAPNNQTP
jgi:hypothetical protein